METKLLILVGIALAVISAYRLLIWFRTAPVRPDPWDDSVSAGMEQADSQALCCRCLEPVPEGRHFCEHCGLPSEPCTNLSPYLYVFSLGDALRTGSFGRFATKPLAIVGFLLLGICEYLVFAPVYWFFLLRNVHRLGTEKSAEPPVIS